VPTLASSSLPFHTLVSPLYSYRRSLRDRRQHEQYVMGSAVQGGVPEGMR
jgi:hypothetical protein